MKSLKNTEKTASFKNKYVTHNDVASYDTKNDLKKKRPLVPNTTDQSAVKNVFPHTRSYLSVLL